MDHTQELMSNEKGYGEGAASISIEDEVKNNSNDSSIAQDPDSAVVKRKLTDVESVIDFYSLP